MAIGTITQAIISFALYERRFNINESLMMLIGKVLRKGVLTNDDLNEFWRSSKEGVFLLDDELNSYIQEVQYRCNIFVTLSKTEPTIVGPEQKLYFLSAFEDTEEV